MNPDAGVIFGAMSVAFGIYRCTRPAPYNAVSVWWIGGGVLAVLWGLGI